MKNKTAPLKSTHEMFFNRLFFSFFLVALVSRGFAQGGGPPMLTDDPGTPPQGKWEINTSFSSAINHTIELEAPLIDINYGYNKRIQLKFEMPYILSKESGQNFTGIAGSPVVGIKYRFIDGDINDLSVSVYPQIAIAIHQNDVIEYKLPLQFEKSFGSFVLGDEIGYVNQEGRNHFFKGFLSVLNSSASGNETDSSNLRAKNHFLFNGVIAGIKFSETFEMMGEMYFVASLLPVQSDNIKVNIGIRYELSDDIIVLCSFGTDVQNQDKSDRKRFFSFTGIQWLL